jgi:hypothetical protein
MAPRREFISLVDRVRDGIFISFVGKNIPIKVESKGC